MKIIIGISFIIIFSSCHYQDKVDNDSKIKPPPQKKEYLITDRLKFINLLLTENINSTNIKAFNDSLKKCYDLDYLLTNCDYDIDKAIKILFLKNYLNQLKESNQSFDLTNHPKEFSMLVKKLEWQYNINPQIEFLNSGFIVDYERKNQDKEISKWINLIKKEDDRIKNSK